MKTFIAVCLSVLSIGAGCAVAALPEHRSILLFALITPNFACLALLSAVPAFRVMQIVTGMLIVYSGWLAPFGMSLISAHWQKGNVGMATGILIVSVALIAAHILLFWFLVKDINWIAPLLSKNNRLRMKKEHR